MRRGDLSRSPWENQCEQQGVANVTDVSALPGGVGRRVGGRSLSVPRLALMLVLVASCQPERLVVLTVDKDKDVVGSIEALEARTSLNYFTEGVHQPTVNGDGADTTF